MTNQCNVIIIWKIHVQIIWAMSTSFVLFVSRGSASYQHQHGNGGGIMVTTAREQTFKKTCRKYTFYNYILRCMTAQLVFFLRAATTPPHCTRTVYCEHAVVQTP